MGTSWEAAGPLRALLKRGSRSFYLTIAVLPGGLRGPVGLAYLLARAADTIADTRLLPPADRLRCLGILRGALDVPHTPALAEVAGRVARSQRVAWEQELVAALPDCHALLWREAPEDRERIRGLLHLLIQGMQQELTRFPAEDAGKLEALDSREELLRHTYYAAGCVGEFWTGMTVAHRPALAGWNLQKMARLGMRFGQGLQLVNVLRDVAADLRLGRCYLPRPELARLGLAPQQLLDPAVRPRLAPLIDELVQAALDCFADGWTYTLAIPRRELRLRLACAWPLLIGLATLDRVRRSPRLLDPTAAVKIRRNEVYAILARSTALAWWNGGLTRYRRSLEARLAVPDGRAGAGR